MEDAWQSGADGAAVYPCDSLFGTHCSPKKLGMSSDGPNSLVEVGARLKIERENCLHLTQEELAEKLEVSKNTVSNWETGKTGPGMAHLLTLKGLGADVDFVMWGTRQRVAEPDAKYFTKEHQALIDNYEHADEEGKAAARRVLGALAKQKTG